MGNQLEVSRCPSTTPATTARAAEPGHVAGLHDRRHVGLRRRHGKGFPDVVILGRRILFRELKTNSGRLEPEQARWYWRLKAAGADVAIWRPGHRRPSWQAAAPREAAEPLVIAFADALRSLGADVQTGVFGAGMAVALVNDGPVTLILEAEN